ncbi:MAG: hypothetical protein ABIW81_08070, partial [Terrimesophilobacter sp.]
LADELDPDATKMDRTYDLRQVAAISETLRTEEAQLRETMNGARVNGRSWNQIAVALSVSGQAARQRFADKMQA